MGALEPLDLIDFTGGTSFDVSPGVASDDGSNGWRGDSVLTAEIGQGFAAFTKSNTDRPHVVLGELGLMVPRPVGHGSVFPFVESILPAGCPVEVLSSPAVSVAATVGSLGTVEGLRPVPRLAGDDVDAELPAVNSEAAVPVLVGVPVAPESASDRGFHHLPKPIVKDSLRTTCSRHKARVQA